MWNVRRGSCRVMKTEIRHTFRKKIWHNYCTRNYLENSETVVFSIILIGKLQVVVKFDLTKFSIGNLSSKKQFFNKNNMKFKDFNSETVVCFSKFAIILTNYKLTSYHEAWFDKKNFIIKLNKIVYKNTKQFKYFNNFFILIKLSLYFCHLSPNSPSINIKQTFRPLLTTQI